MNDYLKSTELPDLPTPEYKYITKASEAIPILEMLEKQPMVEVDTEGTALDPYECQTTLIQVGVPNMAYVFDVRDGLRGCDINGKLFKPLFTNKNVLKLFQNANYDMKVLKVQYGYYVENVYDTMIAEILMYLGVQMSGFALNNLVAKYLRMHMDKEPRGTFEIYDQEFTDTQIGYAARDVGILDIIRRMQMERINQYGLQHVAKLEMDFIKPLAEMELNGIDLNKDRWRIMMGEFAEESKALRASIEKSLERTQDQLTLFGVSSINIDSPVQLKKALNKLGLSLDSTSVEALGKYKGHDAVDNILDYRKRAKLVNTYGEALIQKMHVKTNRLHTRFKQMVSTGRMSSNEPNLQNIPGKQKFRSCFVAPKGWTLITVDQNSAELVIMGAMSGEPNFIEAYEKDLDLHTLNASRIYKVDYDKVKPHQRKASKAISFGLAYGISAVGLGKRLKIHKKEAQKLIDTYFRVNSVLKAWLDSSAKEAIRNHYSTTITGRKRFYNIPAMSDPERRKVVGSVERAAKNHRIQGSDSDTIKQAMIICQDRLEKLNCGAKLLLSVHDEIVVATPDEHLDEVAKIVTSSVDDGFNMYFPDMPMYTGAVIGPCWIKGECEVEDSEGNECGHNVLKFVEDEHYGTKLVCEKCGGSQE